MTREVFDTDGCVGCPPEIGCLGKKWCPQCNYTVIVCDICGEETDGGNLCEDCRKIEEECDNE